MVLVCEDVHGANAMAWQVAAGKHVAGACSCARVTVWQLLTSAGALVVLVLTDMPLCSAPASQSSREELVQDIEELKKKISGTE